MKLVKGFGILSLTALAAGLSLAPAGEASAAQSQTVPMAAPAAQGLAAAADYVWHGRHYIYVWHGHYYNHRRLHNNVYVYF